MSKTYVEDKNGHRMGLMEMNGRRYPIFPAESLKHATEIEARDDDILIATYPKSGTHWTLGILRYLVNRNTVAGTDQDVIDAMIELANPGTAEGQPLNRPRVMFSHFRPDTLSPDFLRKKCKIIYLIRDPRDVVTSFYPHHKKLKHFYDYDGEWDGHLDLFLEGKFDYDSWFDHTKEWEKCIQEHPDNPFLHVTYEGLQQDLYGNVKRINDFIGTNRSDEFIQEVTRRTTFKSMLGDVQTIDGAIYYRKGQTGDWINNFTVAQSELFNEIFEERMKGTNAHKLYSHTIEK